ncbi:hypothetical protein [Nocardia higoensis]|nr:hypothetical protein [Nocardia higoensis]
MNQLLPIAAENAETFTGHPVTDTIVIVAFLVLIGFLAWSSR